MARIEYHILTIWDGPIPSRTIIRRTWPSARAAFKLAVWSAIKAQALLDTRAGHAAYDAATDTAKPHPRDRAPRVRVGDCTVLVEAI